MKAQVNFDALGGGGLKRTALWTYELPTGDFPPSSAQATTSTSGSCTLSESIQNFDYIEIFFKQNSSSSIIASVIISVADYIANGSPTANGCKFILSARNSGGTCTRVTGYVDDTHIMIEQAYGGGGLQSNCTPLHIDGLKGTI